jgi:hypothetical protein
VASIFVSYARESETAVQSLAADVESLDHRVWVDHDLKGGREWWDQILAHIRDCHVFMMALSPESLSSAACKREYSYAAALGKPILPILIAEGVSLQTLPSKLSQIQYVDYRKRDVASALKLANALSAVPPAPALPDPLPEPPGAPLSYLGGIAEQIDGDKPLDDKDQTVLVSSLRRALRDTETKADARVLLTRLRKRPGLYAEARDEIDELLGAPGDAPAPRKAEPMPGAEAASTPESRPTPDRRMPPTSPAPAAPVTRWGFVGTLLMLWVILSPITVAGILSAANAFIVIPVTTLLLAFLRPIQPLHAALFTIVINTTNLIASLAVHDMWEKDQRSGLAALTAVIVINAAAAALISRHRLSRMQQRRQQSAQAGG